MLTLTPLISLGLLTLSSPGLHPPFIPPHVSVIGAPAQSHTPPQLMPSTNSPAPGLVATPTYAPGGVEAKPQASSTPVVPVPSMDQSLEPTKASRPLVPLSTTEHAQSDHDNPSANPSKPHPSTNQPPPAHEAGKGNPERERGGGYSEKPRQQGQARWERGGGRVNNRSENNSGKG